MNPLIIEFVYDSNLVEIMDDAYLDRHDWHPFLEAYAKLLIKDVLSNVYDEVQYSSSESIANEINEKLKKYYGVE